MSAGKTIESLKGFEIPGRVTIITGNGGLPMIKVATGWSTAEIYLHGAHVTRFQRKNELPLLFLSQKSRFAEGQSIRGGVPIILPWFGPKDGEAAHGFARVKNWELLETNATPDGKVILKLRLPSCPEMSESTSFLAEYKVIVGETLELQLTVSNTSQDRELFFENCLHTYFTVGDISSVTLAGLKGTDYLDKVDGFKQKTEMSPAIYITSEVDRVYLDTASTVAIRDAKLRRTILVEKDGSNSTVVWNPWIARARLLADYGDEEYKEMVCVESGNVGKNKITLTPGKSHTLTVKLSSH